MKPEDRAIVITIREYENSVEMPEEERVTYVDSRGGVHLIAGDSQAQHFRDYADKCTEYLRFGDEVDEATCGAYEQYIQLKVCDTPDLLLKAGFAPKPMLYTQRHLEDAIHPKSIDNYHYHGLHISQIKRLPALLELPVLLCDSPSRQDVLLAVLRETDSDNLPLIVAIHPNGKGIYQLQTIETNFILSVYGKNHFEKYFSERITPDMIVYFNQKKSQELERLAGIQFPEYYSNLDPNIIIRRPQCLVNLPRSEPDTARNLKAIGKDSRAVAEKIYAFNGTHIPLGKDDQTR